MADGPEEREHRASASAPALVGKAVASTGVDHHVRFAEHRDPPEHGRRDAGGAG